MQPIIQEETNLLHPERTVPEATLILGWQVFMQLH